MLTGVLAAAVAWSAGCGGGGDDDAAASAPTTRRPFTVRSTLDGKTVLPRRIRWLGLPSIEATDVKQVDFLIDGGRPRWTEREAPYTFGDDENGGHKGYLVTTWLTPGKHRFSVRVTARDGRTSVDTVVARVEGAPEPPSGLGGTWKRTIADTSAAPRPNSTGNPTGTLTPAGRYTMAIDKRWIQVRFPGAFRVPQSDETGEGWILDSDYSARATSLRAAGAVTFDTHHGQAELGWWCWPDGPPATYAWSVHGDTLTVKPAGGADSCAVRGFIWTGDWTRVR